MAAPADLEVAGVVLHADRDVVARLARRRRAAAAQAGWRPRRARRRSGRLRSPAMMSAGLSGCESTNAPGYMTAKVVEVIEGGSRRRSIRRSIDGAVGRYVAVMDPVARFAEIVNGASADRHLDLLCASSRRLSITGRRRRDHRRARRGRRRRVPASFDGIVDTLFASGMFGGDGDDYHDPRNSLLARGARPSARHADHAQRRRDRGRQTARRADPWRRSARPLRHPRQSSPGRSPTRSVAVCATTRRGSSRRGSSGWAATPRSGRRC